MKYVVEVCYDDHNEWSNEEEYYGDALNHALAMSELAGVSETRVWFNDDIVDTCVNGIILDDNVEDWTEYEEPEDEWAELDEPEDEWAEYDEPNYPFDEWGYNPYTGDYDADL